MRSHIRFARGLPGHFRLGLTRERAEAVIKSRLADRGERFLRLLERGVFSQATSPYLPMLRAAGLRFDDVAAMVRREGLEVALEVLATHGVSASFDEFKGRARVARPGASAPLHARDFDNPHLSRYYTGTTGGSSGAGTRVSMELDHYAAQAPHELVATAAYGLMDAPTATWLSVMPSPACFGVMLRRAPFARTLAKWFSQVSEAQAGATLMDRLISRTILAVSRFSGLPFPHPEHVPLDRAIEIARWLRHAADVHGRSVLITHVSSAVRVAVAAREAGIALDSVVMWAGSEPPTSAKVEQIRASGAQWIPGYWMIEAGFLAQGCAAPIDDTDVHLFSDAFALITKPRGVADTDTTVDAFYLTTLLPTAPKLMINVEIDDFGVVERRRCGCPLDALGLDVHLRQIHSLGKLTGEGMTLVGAEAVRILEDVLPARFGGTPLDYQLAEEEAANGLTRVVLIVSPRVGPLDDAAIREAFLAAMGETGPGARLARATWAQASSLQVRRELPRPTAQGKLLPLYVHRSRRP
jgi:hypothetical protein